MQKQVCPVCQSRDVVPILYGMPTLRAHKEASEGKVKLGGCIMNIDNPQFHCKNCQHEWIDEQHFPLVE
jgi:hypothetical protein